jgi:hypothetical protein
VEDEYAVVRRVDLEKLLRELENLKRLFKERSSFRSAGSKQAVPNARS